MLTSTPINYSAYSNQTSFKENTEVVKNAVNNIAETVCKSKSGKYQPMVDKLAELQSQISYICSLLRVNNWFDASNVREEDKQFYDNYIANLEALKKEKKKIIAEMVDPLLKQYENLPDGYRERIIDGEEAGSTWGGYYFNEEELDNRINDMRIYESPERKAALKELETAKKEMNLIRYNAEVKKHTSEFKALCDAIKNAKNANDAWEIYNKKLKPLHKKWGDFLASVGYPKGSKAAETKELNKIFEIWHMLIARSEAEKLYSATNTPTMQHASRVGRRMYNPRVISDSMRRLEKIFAAIENGKWDPIAAKETILAELQQAPKDSSLKK